MKKRKGNSYTRITWPPDPHKPVLEGPRGSKVHTYVDGEPNVIFLTRFSGDRSVRGEMLNACCDCSLTHLWSFEVIRDTHGQFALKARAYRLPREQSPTRPRRKK